MLIPSGINYVGNKFRMLSTVLDNLDTSRPSFIDAFCGGGVVGVNASDYYNNVVMNDGCWQLIAILDAIQGDLNFIDNVEKVIAAYDLGKNNKEQFIECREVFNKKHNKPETFNPYMCYALACHSFSYNMVFNKNGGFSVPSGAGKSWFNPTLRGKLVTFQHVMQTKPIELFTFQFTDLFQLMVESLTDEELRDTMIYLDPPYLNTTATYNENDGWTMKDENDLYGLCENLNNKNIKFGLSNVFINKGVENTKIIEWCNKNNWNVYTFDKFTYMACGKGNSNAKEVFITNY